MPLFAAVISKVDCNTLLQSDWLFHAPVNCINLKKQVKKITFVAFRNLHAEDEKENGLNKLNLGYIKDSTVF